jgi:hypothetical protein
MALAVNVIAQIWLFCITLQWKQLRKPLKGFVPPITKFQPTILFLHQVKFFSWLQKTDAPGMRASLIGLDSGM